MPLCYDLTTFQILGQNLSNFFLGILVQTMTPKGHFEINWPLNKKDFNDVTAAPFLVSFSQLPAAKKNTKNRATVTSLRSFLFRDNFSRCQINGEDFINFCDLLKKHKLYGIHFLSVGHLYFILFCFQKKFLQFLQYLNTYAISNSF